MVVERGFAAGPGPAPVPPEGGFRMCRYEFFMRIPALPQAERMLIQWAYSIAKKWHKGQVRDSGEPYFTHPRDAALVLIEEGYVEADALVVALLHDVPEDQWIALSMLERLFGHIVAREIVVLSKSYGIEEPITGTIVRLPKRPMAQCVREIEACGLRPVLVKCADRISNLTDLVSPPADSPWTPVRRLKKVEETRTHIIPMADRHAPRLAARLRSLCDLIEANASKARDEANATEGRALATALLGTSAPSPKKAARRRAGKRARPGTPVP